MILETVGIVLTLYPNSLAPEEKELFDKEWSFWANAYKGIDENDDISALEIEDIKKNC